MSRLTGKSVAVVVLKLASCTFKEKVSGVFQGADEQANRPICCCSLAEVGLKHLQRDSIMSLHCPQPVCCCGGRAEVGPETVSQAFSDDNSSLATGKSPDVVLKLASNLLSFTSLRTP